MSGATTQALTAFQRVRFGTVLGLGLALAVLSACGDGELILDGERFDVREPLPQLDENGVPQASDTVEARAFAAPAQVNHSSWTHRNGTPSRKIQHPALGSTLTQVWSANIGQGNAKRARITADPIVANGRIFTMDSQSQVVATGSDGSVLWSRKLVPASDKDKDASGGGLAFGENTIFATTGFGELFALEATSGATKWRQKLEAPVTAAPTVADGLVYVVTRDSRAWALNTTNGRIKWQLPGAPSQAVMIGGSGPAMASRVVVFPFGSGEIAGALKKSGIRVWGSSVSGQRRGRAYANISDITGDPVIDQGVIYAANQGGRVVALKSSSGERLWTAREGAYSPVWPSGDSIFLISDQAELVRLDRETGETIWSKRLPYFTKAKIKRRSRIFAHYGPVLAGGRLVVASDDGMIRHFDPATGDQIGETAIRGGAASNPAVVGGTLYVVTANGQLAAFR